MVNFDFRLFGSFPGGYIQYPDDYTSTIFNSEEYRLHAPSQLVIVRDGHMVYYNYYRQLSGSSSNGSPYYLGMSICLNDVYINKPSSVFDIFEQLFVNLAAGGRIIHQSNNGKYVAGTSVFYDKVDEIDQLVSSLDRLLDALPRDGIQEVPSLHYGIGVGMVKDLPFEYADMLLSDAITRSNKIRITKDIISTPVPEPLAEPEPTEYTKQVPLGGKEVAGPSYPASNPYTPVRTGPKGWVIALIIILIAVPLSVFLIRELLPDSGEKSPRSKIVKVNGYEFVDLGLSVLWATRNIGAAAPYNQGNLYAWGEYVTKPRYSHNNYKYCISTSEFTKYVPLSRYDYSAYGNPDGREVLLPEDDAAYRNWGSPCRMPTRQEFLELVEKCSHQWTTQNGMNGMLFTARNGNSIFFPACGYSKSGEMRDYGENGIYLSSTLNVEKPNCAYRFYFDDENRAGAQYFTGRAYGYTIRAVVDRNKVKR